VINLNIGASSTSKGETLLDTVDNLVAMNADMFVVRPRSPRAPHLIAAHLTAPAARTSTCQRRATAATRTRRRACSTCSRSATTSAISATWPCRRRRRPALAVARSLIHGLTPWHAGRARDRPADAAADRAAGAGCGSATTCARVEGCDVIVMLRLQTRADARRAAAFGREFFKHYA